MQQITRKSATASEAIVNGLASIIYSFQGFTLEDFYGSNIRDPMTSSQFFGLAGLVGHLNHELNKEMRKAKRKPW